MAKLLFDVNRQLDTPTLILEAKSGKRYGSLDGVTSLEYVRNLNAPNEVHFNILKYVNGIVNKLWDNVTDLKVIYIPEYKEKFEITMDYTDDEQEIKIVKGKSLCAAELSQTKIRGLEINTDTDLESHNYNITKFYDAENEDLSLLHRVLKTKCSHYTITHVDETLCDLAFEFTANDVSVYDFLTGDVAEKMQCLFLFDSMTRSIEVYDLCSTCNECYDEVIGKDESQWKHYRDDFHDVCPICGKTNITKGYGKDTTILVDKENIATSIQVNVDSDSVKNCLYVNGGDDLINATFAMCNPSGTNYFYRFTEEMMSEMPDTFKTTWNKYVTLYNEYNSTYTFNVSSSIINAFDSVVTKVSSLSDKEPFINYKNHTTPDLRGMKSLTTAYYNAVDVESFIETSMSPSYQVIEYDKYEALAMLTANNIGVIGIAGLNGNTTKTSVDNAVKLVAKTLVNTALYDVEIENSTYSNGKWNGVFSVKDRQNDDIETNTVTNANYKTVADKEEKSESELPTISSSVVLTINGDIETYCKNNIQKIVTKNDLPVSEELYSLDMTDDTFKSMIPLYSIANLEIIKNTLKSCCEVLEDQYTSNNSDDVVVNKLKEYKSTYYNRMEIVQDEIDLKSSYLTTISNYMDSLKSEIDKVHNVLNLENFMKNYSSNEDLWQILNYYRREDTYTNDNIISDNLESDNASLVQQANYLMKFAEKELIKASTTQITISGNLYNLLMYPEFEPLLEYFEVGNWIRVRTNINDEKAEDSIYKLRLLSYHIKFDEKENIEVEFSTVINTWSGMRDIQNVIDSAQVIGTNFDSVKKEVEKTTTVTKTVNGWVNDGLDLTNQKIVSSASKQGTLIDEHGILCRKYDDITDSYDDCQLKIFNNGLYCTHNNWKDIVTGVGKFIWKNPLNKWQEEETYGIIARKIVGEMILGEEARFINNSGTMSFTEDGLTVTNGTNTITINPNGNAFEILKGSVPQLYIDTNGNINLSGGAKISWSELTDTNGKTLTEITENTISTTSVVAQNLQVNAAKILGTLTASQINTTGLIAENISGTTLIGKTISGGSINIGSGNFVVDTSGNLTTKGTMSLGNGKLIYDGSTLSVTGAITATSGTFNGTVNASGGSFSGNITSTAIISGGSIIGTTINNGSGTFSVDFNGNVTATKIDISGTSSIAGWTVTNGKIYGGDGSTGTAVIQRPSSNSHWVFAAGGSSHNAYKDCPFRVGKTGKVVAKDIIIADALKMVVDEPEDNLYPETINIIELKLDDTPPSISFGKNGYPLNIKSESYFKKDVSMDCGLYLGGELSVSGTSDLENVIINGNLRLGNDYSVTRRFRTRWKDNLLHDIITVANDGLATGIGWDGISENSDGTETIYDSTLKLRGQKVKLSNASGVTTSSDERLKNTITVLDEFDDVYMDLNPISFKYNNGASGRKHFGFGAAQVRDAFLSHGFTTKDFGGFVQMTAEENNEEYDGLTDPMGLIYTEFPAWNTHMIQKNIKESKETKQELANLQAKYDKLAEFVGYTE